MEIVILLAFVGLLLAAGGVALFARSIRDGDWQHAERLSLFPIQDDAMPSTPREPQGTITPSGSP